MAQFALLASNRETQQDHAITKPLGISEVIKRLRVTYIVQRDLHLPLAVWTLVNVVMVLLLRFKELLVGNAALGGYRQAYPQG